MPRPRSIVPKYRLHKATGQAVVTVRTADGGRKDVYLGRYRSPESRKEYERIIAQLGASAAAAAPSNPAHDVTVAEALVAFLKCAFPLSGRTFDAIFAKLRSDRVTAVPSRIRQSLCSGSDGHRTPLLRFLAVPSQTARRPTRRHRSIRPIWEVDKCRANAGSIAPTTSGTRSPSGSNSPPAGTFAPSGLSFGTAHSAGPTMPTRRERPFGRVGPGCRHTISELA